jgi:hypothetical protein
MPAVGVRKLRTKSTGVRKGTDQIVLDQQVSTSMFGFALLARVGHSSYNLGPREPVLCEQACIYESSKLV